jgi:hypothetical protein
MTDPSHDYPVTAFGGERDARVVVSGLVTIGPVMADDHPLGGGGGGGCEPGRRDQKQEPEGRRSHSGQDA